MLEQSQNKNLQSLDKLKGPQVEFDKIPVIYSSAYNPALADIQGWHPLDFNKREKVYQAIRDGLELEDSHFYQPLEVTHAELLQIHDIQYLKALENPAYIAEIFQMPELAELDIETLDAQLLRPMRLATGGTLQGVELALQYGWAINLSGGFHHAAADRGEGFCFYADIALAALKARQLSPAGSVLIVDLDAHQGNGTARALHDRERVVIMDVYNEDIYPQDHEAERRVDYKVPLRSGCKDSEYLPAVDSTLQHILDNHDIRFIIYNAGADVAHSDLLGKLAVSHDGVVERDEHIFSIARERGIPCLGVLSGAYGPHAAELIGESLSECIFQTDIYHTISEGKEA